MSRVREALKRANEMQPVQAETEPESQPDRAVRPKYDRLLRNRWVRKLLRLAAVQTNVPVGQCRGTTRMGQPCPGPAMANGYCRLHGGSRQGGMAGKAQGPMEPAMPAR